MDMPPGLRLENKTLVVAVDDDPSLLKLLEKMFSKGEMALFYDLRTFSDLVEAALFIGDTKPQLVLLDLLMPQMNGFKLAQQLQSTCPDTKIIVITGHPTEKNRARLKTYGVNTMIAKPFTQEELRHAVDEAL
jgi:CheY-like chemotaxis protein